MSTYETLLQYGTNAFSTNTNLKAAFDAQDEAYRQAENAELMGATTSFFYHIAILILLGMAVVFLWRIARQKKKESSPDLPTSQIQSVPTPIKNSHAASTHPTARP